MTAPLTTPPATPATPAMPLVSVIVPCREEAGHIRACLDSILATTWPREQLEVLVVDGCSTDGTRAIVEAYARRHPVVRLLDNPRLTAPAGLNIGIRAAAGSVIARMDAHVGYPPDYLPRLVAALERSGADNVGGCIETLPCGPSPVARAIAVALGHPLGVGTALFRTGASRPREVDTVPFGCWRRSVFDRIGLFDEELVRDQDDEFNHRLRRAGGRVLLVPDVVARYTARRSLRDLARMYFQYGWFKPLAARKLGAIPTVRQLVPPAFVGTLVGAAALAPLWPPAAALLAGLGGLYVAVLACVAAATAPRLAPALAAAFAVLHVAYGWGYLCGAWHLARRRGPATVRPLPLSR